LRCYALLAIYDRREFAAIGGLISYGTCFAPGGPADHLRDEIFEACRRNTMMGLVYLRIRPIN
jgi:hypothetical protein